MREVEHPVDALLRARGSTKRWLADQLGIGQSALNRYLAGNRPAPEDLYQRIAVVLQVPVQFVLPPEPVADVA